jgi:hypothetical protein
MKIQWKKLIRDQFHLKITLMKVQTQFSHSLIVKISSKNNFDINYR